MRKVDSKKVKPASAASSAQALALAAGEKVQRVRYSEREGDVVSAVLTLASGAELRIDACYSDLDAEARWWLEATWQTREQVEADRAAVHAIADGKLLPQCDAWKRAPGVATAVLANVTCDECLQIAKAARPAAKRRP